MTAAQVVAALKNFEADRGSLDELLVTAGQADALRDQYQHRSIEVPAWVTEAVDAIGNEVTRRVRDTQIARLRELEQSETALMTNTEKRAKIAEEKAKLQRSLGIATPDPVTA